MKPTNQSSIFINVSLKISLKEYNTDTLFKSYIMSDKDKCHRFHLYVESKK